jgi:hypothetical protein
MVCAARRPQADRRVTDADDPVIEDSLHGLGDHARRVGEVDDPGIRRECPDALGDLEGDRDRAQPVGQPTGPRRLLPEEAEVEGHPHVSRAALQSAHPDGREDEVDALNRLVQRGRRAHRRRVVVPLGHLLQDPADHRQAGWVRVVEAHLLDPSLMPVGEQRPVDQGCAETAASQDRESHAARCSVLAMVPMMGAFWRGDH